MNAVKSLQKGVKAPEEEEAPIQYSVKSLDPSQVCVLDSGGWTTKAGFAGEVMPRSIFPTVVGQPRNQGVTIGMGAKECYLGYQCSERRGILSNSSPIKDGIIQNWDDMEKLWAETIYNDLSIPTDKHSFLVAESAIQPLVAKNARERTAELFFEGFAAEGLYLTVNAVLSLYAAGLTTGTVIDSGADLTLSVPIHEGYSLTRQVTKSHVAGSAITKFLVQKLAEKGYTFTTPDEIDIVTNIKETLCYVTEEFAKPRSQEAYILPDGTELKLGDEAFRSTEYLFDFGLMDGTSEPFQLTTETEDVISSSVSKGISGLVYDSVTKCESSLRPILLNNIVMAGGTTLLEGAKDRLLRDLYTLHREAHPTENTTDVIREGAIKANANRHLSSWMGGSMLGMLSMFPYMLIQKEEYNDVGPGIIHIKCF